ncbi:MAG: methyltransferase domain-containing protein, partial [Proteobacteria bacterium]|nr:methyltransferase domain-containing protein [Pseudomonadota bacterium]
PWTNAEFEQLKGRIWRQGQTSQKVEVVIPVTFADVAGERWSYCTSKLRRLRYKKSIADAAVDGAVPEGNLRTPAQAQRDLMAWLERLAEGESEPIIRQVIRVPLSDEPVENARRLARYGDFSAMNNRWNGSKSGTLADRLATDPEEWSNYHTLYREARRTWTVVPYQEVARWLGKMEGLTVADFGCGEALLAAEAGDRHVIHSLDHVAINDSVLAGDMAHTPLDDEAVGVAVFSLSLMGANFSDYLREAHRVLALDGRLVIWEASSRFDDAKRFGQDLRKLGFGVFLVEERGRFTHIEAMKLDVVPEEGFQLRFRGL